MPATKSDHHVRKCARHHNERSQNKTDVKSLGKATRERERESVCVETMRERINTKEVNGASPPTKLQLTGQLPVKTTQPMELPTAWQLHKRPSPATWQNHRSISQSVEAKTG